ncbi:MAG: nuclear transport factor 2 family protein [Pseudomonadota bacterium]
MSLPVVAQDEVQVVEIEFLGGGDTGSERPTYPEDELTDAADAFFEALGSEDKTALATMMIPEATIFVHNRMAPDNPRVDIVPVAEHLARWAQGTRRVSEKMHYRNLTMSGDLGMISGPYMFWIEGTVSHCGVNYLSMVKTEDGWKVGNTSFTMVPPDQCELVGADWESEQ